MSYRGLGISEKKPSSVRNTGRNLHYAEPHYTSVAERLDPRTHPYPSSARFPVNKYRNESSINHSVLAKVLAFYEPHTPI